MGAKRYPLPKRLNVALSEKAYANLRGLNEKYGYSNNYLLTILLENIQAITSQAETEKVFDKFNAEYGAPNRNVMKKKN